MKLAVTATESKPKSLVDPRFGRARWFLVYDTESESYKPLDNSSNVDAMQGAGIRTAELLSGSGAVCVVTGHCGPKAFEALKAAGIKVVAGAEGTVEEAVKKYLAGELEAIDRPDVAGRWS
jgi:predicted Fe-Mo cluster-binding NifX family protein